MNLITDNDWQLFLEKEFTEPYFLDLNKAIATAYKSYTCYPPKQFIFNAFDTCKFKNLKVVIIGQDPYHGDGQANGLAFSINDGCAIPPSLRNVFREINNDFEHLLLPTSGNLERWATQGVLLLNASLTVQKDMPNSHKNFQWQRFTDAVISKLSQEKHDLVFLLWGNFAIQKSKFIDQEKHLVLTSGHPSPMSANQGKWFGNKHFSQVNSFLKFKNIDEIEW